MPCAPAQRLKALGQRDPDRVLDEEADDLRAGGVDEAFFLLLCQLGRRLAASFGPQPLDVGDRLLENMADHFPAVIPVPEFGDILRQLLRQDERVDERVIGEEPPLYGGMSMSKLPLST
jgi:hypothetical protein